MISRNLSQVSSEDAWNAVLASAYAKADKKRRNTHRASDIACALVLIIRPILRSLFIWSMFNGLK
jgi:hypothetical protein